MMQIRRASGFTIIELLVVMTIAAIVLTLAVPGFGAFIRANRAEVQSSALVNAFNYARSEAVRRGQAVRITSMGGGDWQAGWRVWVDVNGNGSFDAGTDQELQFQAGFSGDATLTASGGATQVVFNRLGNLDGVTAGNSIQFAYRLGADFCNLERDITINHLGRVASSRRDCS